jgi:small redox-active disulfide protein 2
MELPPTGAKTPHRQCKSRDRRTDRGDIFMDIKILEPGCANCRKMEELAIRAARELGIDAKVEKIAEIREIMKYTISTPGLVVNGKLKFSGKPMPSLDKVKELIRSEV